MEALQLYNSDSDDSIDNLAPDEAKSSIVRRSDSDFFHLQNSDGEDIVEPESKVRKIEVSSITINSGEALTVPESDFWKPVGLEIRTSNDQPFSSDARTLTGAKSVKNLVHDYTGSYCKRKNIKNPSCEKVNKTYCANDHQTKSVAVKKEEIQNNENELSEIPDRKMFKIHGKMKPWLQRQAIVCKIPKHCDKSWQGHSNSINKVKWCTPKYSHLLLSASMDTTVKIWNVWSSVDRCVRTLRLHSKGVQDCDWNNTGTQILSCSYDKNAIITDIETGKPLIKFGHRTYVTCGKFHPSLDNVILTGSLDELTAWDIRQKDEPIHRYSYKDKIGQIQDVIFSRDGKEFFSTSDLISRDSADRNIMAWDFDNAIVRSNQIYQERYSCTCLKLHPVDNYLLAQSHGNYIALFSSVKPYKMNRSLRCEGHKLGGYKIGFDISPDGRYVVSGDVEGKIYNYNYRNGHVIHTLHSSLDVTLDIAFHPLLPTTLACCGWNGSIELWN